MIRKHMLTWVMVLVMVMSGSLSACSAVQPGIGAGADASYGQIPVEGIREGLRMIMRAEPNAMAFYAPELRRWAYTFPYKGTQVMMFSDSTGALLKWGGYAFKVSPGNLDGYIKALTSNLGGYEQWIPRAIILAATRNPGLVSIMMIPGASLEQMSQAAWDQVMNDMFPDVCFEGSTNPNCET